MTAATAVVAGGFAVAPVATAALTRAPAAGREVRIGVAPVLPAGTPLVAGTASARRMRIAVALKPRHAAALRAYALSVSDPGSADYRHYLTPRQFVARFAPTAATIDAVESSLRAHGLTPGPPSANRLAISVQADGAQIERAFAMSLEHARLADGADVVVNSAAPAFDARIAGAVQAVVGLNGLERMRPTLVRAHGPTASGALSDPRATVERSIHIDTGGPQPCAAATATASAQSAYTADQIAASYGFSGLYQAGDQGAGQTIALYELESDSAADIATFQSCYGTNVPLSYVKVDGGAGNGAGLGEAALDVEQLIGLAPRIKLIIYQGPNSNADNPGSGPYDTFSQIISQDRAKVVSNSWGECEPVEGRTDASAENVLFEEAAAQGQTIVSAAGDDGSEDCYSGSAHSGGELAVDDPASQPFVTGVGGTSLSSLGPIPNETVWNSAAGGFGPANGSSGSGGGGVSELWPMPSYQSDAPAALNVLQSDSRTNCRVSVGYCREVPDVAASADPNFGYLIYYNGSGAVSRYPTGWQSTGGTSGAAPVWAALFALADAQPACGGVPLGFANPALYRTAAQGQSTYFNDVASGDNDFLGNFSGLYPAGPGYDMATGLGSPKAAPLASALCAESLRLVNPGSRRTVAGAAVNVPLTVADAAGNQLAFSARGLPSGLTINPATGTISGTPSTPTVSRVTVSVSDAAGGLQGAKFSWIVQGRPAVANQSLSQRSGAGPVLAFTVRAGQEASAIRRITLALPSAVRLARRLRNLWVLDGRGHPLGYAVRRGAHDTLAITLRSPRYQVRVVLGNGSLVADSGLVKALNRGPTSVALTLTVTDGTGITTPLVVAVVPRR